jgi:DNA-binding NarL/FixJ family response regulator
MSAAPRGPCQTIVLADDHPAFRMGVRQYLEGTGRYYVIGECSDGEACLERLRTLRPDWAIVDLAMPRVDGFGVLEAVRRERIATRIVVFSMHAETAYAEHAREKGASGFIAKEDALTEIDSALAVPEGAFFRSRAVGRSRGAVLKNEDAALLGRLTPAEQGIVELLGGGLTSKEIARALGISPRTVQAHRRNIADKLDLHGPNRLLEFAVRNQRAAG